MYVAGLTEGGAAYEAGIKEGDVITRVGDVVVNTAPELQEQVSRFRPGDKIYVTLIRDNEEKKMPVTLRNKNGNTDIVKDDRLYLHGANLVPVSMDEMTALGIKNGVKVVDLDGGKLRSAGIKEGFIIQSIDKRRINTAEDIKLVLNDKKGGVLIEGIYPNGVRAYYGFGL